MAGRPLDRTKPTPDGPQPADWPDIEWVAYMAIQKGASAPGAALEVGRSAQWVRNLIRQWRLWWGYDFIPRYNASAARRYTVPPPSPSAIVGGGSAQLVSASRVAQANLFGATAAQAAQIIQTRLTQMVASPSELGMLSPRDLVDLARVVAMLDQRTAAILGEESGNGRGMGGTRADVDLSGLESGHTDGDRATIDAARLIVSEFHERRRRDEGGEEIIEVPAG